MKKAKRVITEQILNLTLEILYLLTGEDYIIVKKPGRQTKPNNRLQVIQGISRTLGNVLLTPPHSVTPQEDNDEKILQLTNKIIELLTGEVPVRCQDVTVSFSMEEWEYLERHKDLYKDFLMDNQLPDGPICRNSLFHNVTSDIVNEDDTMDTESETESLKVHNPRDMQIISNGIITEETSGYKNLSDVDHDSSICIKEEPFDISWDEGNLPNATTHSAVQFHSLHVKEELGSYGRENLTDPYSYTPIDHAQHHPSPHIIEESVSCGRQNLTQPNFHTFSDPSQYPSTHNIEKPISYDTDNHTKSNTCTPIDHTQQYPSPHIMEKPSSSNKKDFNDPNMLTVYFPILIKEEPIIRIEHIDPNTCKYPTQQSTLVEQSGTALSKETKPKILPNTVTEPIIVSTIPNDQKTDNDENCYKSSSVYSVHESDNAVEILYHCPSCQKGFYSNLELARHQVIHTVDKLFVCTSCGKSFTELSFLIKHQVIHTDLKLCVCPVCGGCFYSEASLAKHQKNHSTPMYCSTCGRCFFDKKELEIHKQKHGEERPYGCLVCGKQFIGKAVFNQHLLTHTQARQSR